MQSYPIPQTRRLPDLRRIALVALLCAVSAIAGATATRLVTDGPSIAPAPVADTHVPTRMVVGDVVYIDGLPYGGTPDGGR